MVRSSYKNLRWYLPEGAKDGSLSSCPKGSPMFVRQRPRARPGDASPRDLSHEGPLHTSSTRPPLPPDLTVRRQNSVRREVVDLPAPIRRRSWFDDHPPAPALRLLPFLCGGHRQLALENLALHQQLAVYKRTVPRPKLRTTDRLFWLARARVWAGWRLPLVIVTPTPFCGGSGAGSVSTGDLLPDFAPLRLRGSGQLPA